MESGNNAVRNNEQSPFRSLKGDIDDIRGFFLIPSDGLLRVGNDEFMTVPKRLDYMEMTIDPTNFFWKYSVSKHQWSQRIGITDFVHERDPHAYANTAHFDEECGTLYYIVNRIDYSNRRDFETTLFSVDPKRMVAMNSVVIDIPVL